MEKSLPADDYASGAWVGKPGHEEEFIERWIEFLEWTRQTFHELNKAILIRDTDEPNRFVWLAYWGERGRHGLVAISQRFRPATGSLPSLLRRVLRKHLRDSGFGLKRGTDGKRVTAADPRIHRGIPKRASRRQRRVPRNFGRLPRQ